MAISAFTRWCTIRSALLFLVLGVSVDLIAQNDRRPLDTERLEVENQAIRPLGWGLKSAGGIGWPTKLQLLEQTTSDVSYVGLVGLHYRGSITNRWAWGLTAEVMFTYRSGEIAGRDYRVRKLSPGIEGLLAFQLPYPRWHLHAGMQLRTDRPVSLIDIKRRDNFRLEPRIMGSYQVGQDLHLTTTIGRSLRSRDDSTYFSDPHLQMLIGLLWTFRPQ